MNERPGNELTPKRYESSDYQREITEENARASILAASPNFEIKTMKRMGGGLGNMAFMVNNEYLFRFPRHGRSDESLQVEMRLLPALEKHVTLPIPHFEIVGKQTGSDLHFVGYKAIPGVEMEPKIMRDPDGKPNNHFTQQIATFFRDVHSFSVETAKGLGVPERNLKTHMMGEILDAREHVFPMVQKKISNRAEQIIENIEVSFRDYLSDSDNFDYEPKLTHGDLEAEHIFVDPRKRTITGIIDFGGARLDDPDYDLWRPYFHFGKEFIDLLLQNYPHKNPKQLYKKMEFFWTAQECHRAVRAIMKKDEGRTNRTLERIKKRLSNK